MYRKGSQHRSFLKLKPASLGHHVHYGVQQSPGHGMIVTGCAAGASSPATRCEWPVQPIPAASQITPEMVCGKTRDRNIDFSSSVIESLLAK